MKMRLLAALILLPITASAQQTTRPASTSAPNPANSRVSPMLPPQILDDNHSSIAVIVAAGNTSLRLGTGFFVNSKGLLLTNLHVVEGTNLVGVKIPGSEDILWARRATGFDVDNDLVVLEVETSGKKPVSLGDSDQARVGEPIVVIGNPEGLEQTVSNGLVSGIREVDGRELFQISAPISEGSSGSPVFDSHGDVIGVVVSTLESGQNLNFAVPINYAKSLLTRTTEELISALPKENQTETQAGIDANPRDPATDPAKLAIQAMSKIADEIRACEGFTEITPTKEKKPHYSRIHYDPATDVRFDVKPSDSVVTPFEGIVEFSIHHGVSLYLRSAAQAASAPDNLIFSGTTRDRYFYRIDGSNVRLDYRTFFDSQKQNWVLMQGKPNMCWDRIANQDSD